MNEPLVEPLLAVDPESSFKTNAPLIPRDSVAGRALVVVIAIMTFLACLTAGAALLVAHASQAWRSDVLREATIQVKPGVYYGQILLPKGGDATIADPDRLDPTEPVVTGERGDPTGDQAVERHAVRVVGRRAAPPARHGRVRPPGRARARRGP